MVGYLCKVQHHFLMESQGAALKASGHIREVGLKGAYPVEVSSKIACLLPPFNFLLEIVLWCSYYVYHISLTIMLNSYVVIIVIVA